MDYVRRIKCICGFIKALQLIFNHFGRITSKS